MPPENTGEDKDFDMVCSFRAKPDGMICMTKLGDHPMPGYDGDDDDEEDRDHKPSYRKMATSLIDSLGDSGAPAADSYNAPY